jgi:hypothetical protein
VPPHTRTAQSVEVKRRFFISYGMY